MSDEAVVPVPVPVPPPPGTDWTGPYVGLQYDILSGEASEGGDRRRDIPREALRAERLYYDDTLDIDGDLFGVFAGYRYDFGSLVIGGEVDYMTGDGDIDIRFEGSQPFDIDSLVRLGGEVGFDLSSQPGSSALPLFVYATAGYAYIDISTETESNDSGGYFFGAGADYLVTDNLSIGVELLQHNFSDFDIDDSEIEATTFGINAAFRF